MRLYFTLVLKHNQKSDRKGEFFHDNCEMKATLLMFSSHLENNFIANSFLLAIPHHLSYLETPKLSHFI